MKKVNFFYVFLAVVIIAAAGGIGWRVYQTKQKTNDIKQYSVNTQEKGIGNTLGNAVNGGYLCKYGDYIYYSKPNDGGKLHRMKLDGSDDKRLNNDWPDKINIIGDKIYYINETDRFSLYRCDLNGKHNIQVSDNLFLSLYVKDGWAYYARKRSKVLNRMTLDGKYEQKLDVDSFTFSVVHGDWVYYCNLDDNLLLYKVKVDNTQKQKVSNISSFNFQILSDSDGDMIYYSDLKGGKKLFKAKLDGSQKTQLTKFAVSNINVDKESGRIYLCNEDNGDKLYSMDLEGNNLKKLNDDETTSINVAGKVIHYINESDYGRMYSINPDGTGRLRIENE